MTRRAADQRSARPHRDRSGPADRVGAGPRWEGREAQDGRDGRLGVGARRSLDRGPDPTPDRPAVLHPRQAHPRARMVSDRRTRRPPAARRAGRSPAAVRAAPATPRARHRDGARRDTVADHSEAARACTPRDHVAGSGRGAVPALPPVRFPDPPAEPDLPIPEHPALHRTCAGRSRSHQGLVAALPLGGAAWLGVHGVGIRCPRYR